MIFCPSLSPSCQRCLRQASRSWMTIFAALTYHILHRHETTTTLASHAMQRPSETSMAFADYHYKQSEASWPYVHVRAGPTSASDCVARVTGPGTCPDVTLDARPLTGWSLVGRWAWQSLTPHVLPRLSGLWLDYHVTSALLGVVFRCIQNLYCCRFPSKEKSSVESPILGTRGAEECNRGVSPCRTAAFVALYDDTPRSV
ncbi:uncharacterized protein BDZ83DRAFT_442200 [Colletotrichum acutatum]|uniref:Uncharacterized protein n=1 Tax=Glomerella acutata TaxID=27357 RepID=A0AAD8UD17_GLOAC|nr:uncharacterized protein BDZ83DRAFT_442200 [Colletotrichum acutatum]KAK1720421.1 hypothetical protein BDZ83DRAFT_442200 [Colletotrichum acutatum]